MKKKLFVSILALIICLNGVHVMAYEGINLNPNISLKMNGTNVYFENAIINKDSRTFLPLRELCESIGITEISYDPAYSLIFIKDDNTSLFMQIDTQYYQIKDQIFELSVAPIRIEETTYVPIRLVAEAFDFEVSWDNDTRTIFLEKDGYKVPKELQEEREAKVIKIKPSYSEDDLYWLGKIVTVEGMNLSHEGKLAIANVVYNRVKSPDYPNTVHDVIFQIDSGYVQFPPAHKSSFKGREASEDAKKAALEALTGTNNIENCLFFNNAPFSSKPNIFKVIEGEYFYK